MKGKKTEWYIKNERQNKKELCAGNCKSVLRKCEMCADHDENKISNFCSTSLPLSVGFK
jgi:hypothetical protein